MANVPTLNRPFGQQGAAGQSNQGNQPQSGQSGLAQRGGQQGGGQQGSDEAQKHSEGAVARGIEHYTAQMPSDWFLWAAGASILASLTFHILGRKEDAQFVGQWVAPFMLLGVYNKIVKVAGSDRVHES